MSCRRNWTGCWLRTKHPKRKWRRCCRPWRSWPSTTTRKARRWRTRPESLKLSVKNSTRNRYVRGRFQITGSVVLGARCQGSSPCRAPWHPSTQSCRSWRRWPTTRGRGSQRWCPRCSRTWLRSAWPSEATTSRCSCSFLQTLFSFVTFLLEARCGVCFIYSFASPSKHIMFLLDWSSTSSSVHVQCNLDRPIDVARPNSGIQAEKNKYFRRSSSGWWLLYFLLPLEGDKLRSFLFPQIILFTVGGNGLLVVCFPGFVVGFIKHSNLLLQFLIILYFRLQHQPFWQSNSL